MERRAQQQELAEVERRRAAQERSFAAQTRESMATLQAELEAGDERFQREQRSLGAEGRQAAGGRALWPAEPQRCALLLRPKCTLYSVYNPAKPLASGHFTRSFRFNSHLKCTMSWNEQKP